MIYGNFAPLGRRSSTKPKARRKLHDPAKLPGDDVDDGVSFSHFEAWYSTANRASSSTAIPAVLVGSPQWVMSLGDKIRKARAASGLSQLAVAEGMMKTGLVKNFTKSALSQWETNLTKPDLFQFIAFCAVTGASADEILLNKKLQGVEKRIGALPESLREYVFQTITLAEEAKPHVPERFLAAPTRQTYQEFHKYIAQLAERDRPSNLK